MRPGLRLGVKQALYVPRWIEVRMAQGESIAVVCNAADVSGDAILFYRTTIDRCIFRSQ